MYQTILTPVLKYQREWDGKIRSNIAFRSTGPGWNFFIANFADFFGKCTLAHRFHPGAQKNISLCALY